MAVTNDLARGRRHAVGLGLLGALLVSLLSPTHIDGREAVASADVFPEDASLSDYGRTWTVSSRGEQVMIDAQTGDAVEFVFRPAGE